MYVALNYKPTAALTHAACGPLNVDEVVLGFFFFLYLSTHNEINTL